MLVLTLILVMSTMKADACPSILFVYDAKCYAECPTSTLNIAGTNQCVDHCPSSSPIRSARNKCDKFCPIGYRLHESTKTCVSYNEIDTITKHSSHSGNEYFVNCHCLPHRPYCYELQCYKECPENTKDISVNGQHCVEKCPDSHPFTNRNSCIKQCPSTKRFNFRKTCVSSCQKPLYTYGITCVETCPIGMVSVDYVCTKRCPSSMSYMFESDKGNVCTDECPVNTNMMGNRCKIGCNRTSPFLFNMTCIPSCPHEAPYGMRMRGFDLSILVCIPSCPDDRVRDGMFCVEKCTSEMAIFNRSCVEFCPNNTFSYTKNGINKCVFQCPASQMFTFERKCLTQCPTGTSRINSTECVEDCRETEKPYTYKDFPGFVGTCMIDCPPDTFYHNFRCVEQCETSSFVANRTCLSKCPPDMPYQLEHIYTTTLCLNKCPNDMFVHGNSCFSSCPLSIRYILNGECLTKCPESHPYLYNTGIKGVVECKLYCEPGLVTNGLKCEKTCPYSTVVHNNTCLDKCPQSSPYRHSSSKGKECCNQCPNGLYATQNYECVSNCHKLKQLTLQYNNSCVKQCPKRFPFKQNIDKDTHCKTQCKNGTYSTEDNECVSKCYDRAQFTLNNRCFEKCPLSHPYHLDMFSDLNSGLRRFICSKKCENNTIAFEDTFKCVHIQECIGIRMKILDGKCVRGCPNNSMQIFNFPSQCLQIGKGVPDFLLGTLLAYSLILILACIYMCTLQDMKHLWKAFRSKRKLATDEDETCVLVSYPGTNPNNNEHTYTEALLNDQTTESLTMCV